MTFAPRRNTLTKPVKDTTATQFTDEWQRGAPDPNAPGLLSADLANIQYQDTKILQKVNAAHREAFSEKYPGQVEHCLRLTMERLQAGLDKRGMVDIANPQTWILMPGEIRELAEAARALHEIRNSL